MVFQNPDNQLVASIVEDDVAFGAENIGLPREEIGERIEFALSAVGMEEYRYSTPARMSGGQKQRIAIAGVLAVRPEVLVLDESTAMLDPRGRREVMEVVERLNRENGMSVVLITHYMDEVAKADRVIVLSDGRIAMTGSPREVLFARGRIENVRFKFTRTRSDCAETARKGRAGKRCRAHRGGAFGGIMRIVAEGLNYTYSAKSKFAVHALKDVSLTVEEGEFFAIVGHTGSGKSTFVQHLNGLIRVGKHCGKLTVGEYDLTAKKCDLKALRSKIGMVFQYPEYQLFAETVAEDVAFGLKNFEKLTPEQTAAAVKEAMETVGLPYEEFKDKSPFEMSGGQKRRAAIAGVIVTKPEVLVLDEPVAGLDPQGKRDFFALLHELHRTFVKTVIFISHDMDDVAEHATKVAVFDRGEIFRVGTPRELFSEIPDELLRLGLDLPATGRLKRDLARAGVKIDTDFTAEDFVNKVAALYGGME